MPRIGDYDLSRDAVWDGTCWRPAGNRCEGLLGAQNAYAQQNINLQQQALAQHLAMNQTYGQGGSYAGTPQPEEPNPVLLLLGDNT